MKKIFLLFLCASLAFADAAATPTMGQRLFDLLPMVVGIFCIFYLMVIVPENKKIKEQTNLLQGLTNGTEVITKFGLIGRVAGIEKDYILLEIANNVKVKVVTDQIDKIFGKENGK